jgi:hypothetical protein
MLFSTILYGGGGSAASSGAFPVSDNYSGRSSGPGGSSSPKASVFLQFSSSALGILFCVILGCIGLYLTANLGAGGGDWTTMEWTMIGFMGGLFVCGGGAMP